MEFIALLYIVFLMVILFTPGKGLEVKKIYWDNPKIYLSIANLILAIVMAVSILF